MKTVLSLFSYASFVLAASVIAVQLVPTSLELLPVHTAAATQGGAYVKCQKVGPYVDCNNCYPGQGSLPSKRCDTANAQFWCILYIDEDDCQECEDYTEGNCPGELNGYMQANCGGNPVSLEQPCLSWKKAAQRWCGVGWNCP